MEYNLEAFSWANPLLLVFSLSPIFHKNYVNYLQKQTNEKPK